MQAIPSYTFAIQYPKFEKKQSEKLHIKVTTKHTKVNTPFDSGSQVKLISKAIV